MDDKARAFLGAQFAHAPLLQAEMLELWSTFRDLGLPNDDFFSEFTNGKRPSLAQRTWEMLLARHLHQQGHKLTCPNGGPDFKFDLDGMTVWVEAVAPEPKGLPAEWLDASFTGVRDTASRQTNKINQMGVRKHAVPEGQSVSVHESLVGTWRLSLPMVLMAEKANELTSPHIRTQPQGPALYQLADHAGARCGARERFESARRGYVENGQLTVFSTVSIF